MVASVLASMGILTIGWDIGVAATVQTTTAVPGSTGSTGSTGTGSSAPTGSTGTGGSSSSTGLADGTYTGSDTQTRFGSVQVSVTISGGQITDVTALQLTDSDGRSVQISNRAAPILRQEVLASQSANVSNVNGATYTTDAYLTSVQSALDQAAA